MNDGQALGALIVLAGFTVIFLTWLIEFRWNRSEAFLDHCDQAIRLGNEQQDATT